MEMIGKKISINRGNIATLRLKRKNGNFEVGDEIKFSIVNMFDYNDVKLQKIVTIDRTSQFAYIELKPEDTRFDEIPYDGIEYRYEILYNGNRTLIGANGIDNNVIVIYAEAGDKRWN